MSELDHYHALGDSFEDPITGENAMPTDSSFRQLEPILDVYDSRLWVDVRNLWLPETYSSGHQSLVLNADRDVVVGVIGAYTNSIRDGENTDMGKGPFSYELVNYAVANESLVIVAPQKHGEAGAPNFSSKQREQLRKEARYTEIGLGMVKAFEQARQEPSVLVGTSEGGREVLGVAATGAMRGKLKTVIMIDPVGVEDQGMRSLLTAMKTEEDVHKPNYRKLPSADLEVAKLMDVNPQLISRWRKQKSTIDQLYTRGKALAGSGLEQDLREALAQDPSLKIVWISAEHSEPARQQKVIEIYSRLTDKEKAQVTLVSVPEATHSFTQYHPNRVATLIGDIATKAA